VRHWEALAGRLEPGSAAGEPLEDGVAAARALLDELGRLTPRYGLYGDAAAIGVGSQLAGGRNLVGDRFLERNQALRLAVLDAQHVTTLLGYLAEVAAVSAAEPVRDLTNRYEKRLRSVERAVRRAAVESGDDPDGAVAPLDPSGVGRTAHGVAMAVGTVGEWVDRRLGGRRSPRS